MNCATYNLLLDVGKNIGKSLMVKLIWEIRYFIPSYTPRTMQLAFQKFKYTFLKPALLFYSYLHNPATLILQVDFQHLPEGA